MKASSVFSSACVLVTFLLTTACFDVPSSNTACVSHSGEAICNFGSAGIAELDSGLPDQYGSALALQSDGKLLVTGYVYDFNDPLDTGRVVVARYLTNGSLDTSFATGGKYLTSVDNNNWLDGNWVGGIAVQTDGKIVFTVGNQDLTVVRLNADGTLDTSFGTGGIYQDSNIGRAHQLALQSDGKIVVGTSQWVNPGGSYAVARLNTNGTLDNSFGTNGVANFESLMLPGQSFAVQNVAIQSDGKIVASGKLISSGGGTHEGFELARFNTDGTFDNTFGSNGQVSTDLGPSYATPLGLAIQSDGSIVIAGKISAANPAVVIRYLSDGTLDPSFGTTGVLSFSDTDPYGSLALQGDGKILFNVGDKVYRITSAGVLDSSFATAGAFTLQLLVPGAMIADSSKFLVLGRNIAGTKIAVEGVVQ